MILAVFLLGRMGEECIYPAKCLFSVTSLLLETCWHYRSGKNGSLHCSCCCCEPVQHLHSTSELLTLNRELWWGILRISSCCSQLGWWHRALAVPAGAAMGSVPSCLGESLSCCGEPKPVVTVLVVLAQLPWGREHKRCLLWCTGKPEPIKVLLRVSFPLGC